MSRTIILSLATAATIAVASLASSAADARGFGGGGRRRLVVAVTAASVAVSAASAVLAASVAAVSAAATLAASVTSAGRRLLISPATAPGIPGHWNHWTHFHNHHWFWRDGRWVLTATAMTGGDYAEPVAARGRRAGGVDARALHLPDQELHAGRHGGVRRPVHQGSAVAPVDGRAAETPPQCFSPPSRSADDKASDAAPIQTQSSSNFAGRSYKDFLLANGLPVPDSTQQADKSDPKERL